MSCDYVLYENIWYCFSCKATIKLSECSCLIVCWLKRSYAIASCLQCIRLLFDSSLPFILITFRMLRQWRNQHILQVFLILSGVFVASSFILYLIVNFYLPTHGPSLRNISDDRLQYLMSDEENEGRKQHPLERLVLSEGSLNFYHLPKRLMDVAYDELTSANRDTSYPLAPDFTFHIR